MQPRLLLRLEGLAIALAGALGYVLAGGDLLLFVPLVLWPDLSIGAYLAGRRAGSAAYNAVHLLALPVALLVWSLRASAPLGTVAALAWLAHVGADRAFGLGLKYDGAPFRETHLQRV